MGQKVYNQTNFINTMLNISKQASIATAGPLNGAKLHLFTGAPVLNPNNVIGDFTEANYHGYAAQSIVWDATPYIQADQTPAIRGQPAAAFNPTDAVVPNIVTGYFVTDSAGLVILYASFFDVPWSASGVAKFLTVSTFATQSGAGGISGGTDDINHS